ncbi:redoxin domain-containing protein [Anaerolineae bacterium CFX8]|nr:redoxin domain-containing protein [Anaerolineae bacterium CFX8]
MNTVDIGLKVGQTAPHFSAVDDQKKPVHLEGLLENGKLLLAFIHGTWCPHCVQTIYRLRRAANTFAQEGIGIAVVAIDDPKTLGIFRQSAVPTIPFTLLADNDQSVHKAYHLEQVSAYIALDKAGIIRGVFIDADHHSYPGHAAIVQALH